MRLSVFFLMLSIFILYYVEFVTRNTPFPDGIYLGERYRISDEEPDATIKAKFVVKSEHVDQQLTLTDVSLSNHAVFKYKGTLSSCSNFTCVYTRKGTPLVLADIKDSHYHSKYLELLSNRNKSSKVKLIFKRPDYIVVFELSENRPYLYAVTSHKSL
ncbi:hypothetical protein [Aeromonas veronii]|uniref:hypothetical protein n=1 Tax=Aeromonas veronii TaxID=654 RepID=UPI001118C51C|nr:hypothetical protein [Aeromonas veronii]